jgi:hypothetical protein
MAGTSTAKVYDLREELSREQARNKRASWNVGEMWNNAHIHGEASEEFDALMGFTAPLIEKDWGKRFMPTRGWRPKAKTWGEWLDDSLTWHREDDRKDGAGYVFGASANGERKAENMRGMVAVGLDIEPEQPLDDVIDRCEASGLAIVLYTSHNHERTSDCEAVDKILEYGDEVTTETVRAYLVHKGAYSEDFISQCELTDPRADIDGKIQAVWSCPPLQKMRAVALFEEPVDITTLDPSPKRGQEIWANKVRGLAQMLGVRIDPVATDPSRILYIAKHRPSADYYCAVFRGRPVRWDEIPEVAKSADNPFLQAGGKGGSTVPDVTTSTGIDVTALYRRYGKRWMLADMLSDSHVAKSEGSDRLHVECPFSDEHTSESGPTSTTVWNAGETERGFAKVLCQHTCKDRYHTMHYIARWIEDGVIDPDWLEDDAFMIGAPVQPGPFEELTPAELEEERADAAEQARSCEELAGAIDGNAPWSEIEGFCKRIYKEGADKTAQVNVAAIIAKNTNHTRPDVKAVFKELDEAARKVQAGRAQELMDPVVNEWDFTRMHEHSAERIHAANGESPSVFHNAHDLCAVRAGSDGRHAIRALDKDGFAHHLNSVVQFVKTVGEDKTPIGVAAPKEVVNYLYAADRSAYPPLRGLVTTPAFTAAGGLLTQPGYDWDSQLFFQPDPSLTIPEVSDVPTEDEVFEAKRLLVQEVLADFMLDGMDRAETIRKALCCEEVDGELQPIPGAEPEATPSLSHAIVMAVFPFVRDMIGGNAAGIAIDKQKPGAGAGKLEAAMSAIYAGRGTAAMALPTNPEEMTKVLLPALRSGDPNVFFDNINAAVDSGELASAMTAPTYRARVLNKSETVEVEVRCQWVVAGNKLRLSDELTRRFALIYLDPKTATPEARTGFRHPEIEEWVRENRGRLIWACLTLAQNWIASGRQPGSKGKASYSQWARVMGGILDAAGTKGFLVNEKDMKARSSVSDDPVRQLVERLADYEDGQLFVTGSVAKRHPHGTESIKATLEGFHADEEGDAQCLRLPGWGYDSFGTYSSPQKLGTGFKRDVAAEPHKVGDVEVLFEPVENASGVKLWRMVKRDPANAG